jgi:LPXTG-motif cell wall-anchored protein
LGTFSGSCDVVGSCGQFHSTLDCNPDSIKFIYDFDFPDTTLELSGGAYASGTTYKVSDNQCHEMGKLIEYTVPSGACSSAVTIDIFSPLITGYEGPEKTTLSYTIVHTSDTTFSFSGTATTLIGLSAAIPTLTEWGMIIFGVVLLGFISWVFFKRRKAALSLR